MQTPCNYVGPLGDVKCDLAGSHAFRWPWGAEGTVCAHHVPHLDVLAQQLNCQVVIAPLTPPEVPSPERDTLPPGPPADE